MIKKPHSQILTSVPIQALEGYRMWFMGGPEKNLTGPGSWIKRYKTGSLVGNYNISILSKAAAWIISVKGEEIVPGISITPYPCCRSVISPLQPNLLHQDVWILDTGWGDFIFLNLKSRLKALPGFVAFVRNDAVQWLTSMSFPFQHFELLLWLKTPESIPNWFRSTWLNGCWEQVVRTTNDNFRFL